MSTESISEILEGYGYKAAGKCHCDGFETEKYNNGAYQIRIRIHKKQFRIKKDGRSLSPWNPITNLSNSLKTLHGEMVAAV